MRAFSYMLPVLIACAGLPFILVPQDSAAPNYNPPPLPELQTPDDAALASPDAGRKQRLIDGNPFSPARQPISAPTLSGKEGGGAGDPHLLGTIMIEDGPVAILRIGQKTHRAQQGQIIDGWVVQQIGPEACDVSRGGVNLRLTLRPKTPQRQQTPPGV